MRIKLDSFTLVLVGTILLASFWPAQGEFASVLGSASTLAVAMLFFLHGAALSRQEVLIGAAHWRLHLLIVSLTFVMFPLLVVPISALAPRWIPEDLALGFLYLGVLPSAVSSSIAFTAMAKGNVPAAVCSAAASNVFGMMLTPFLLMLLVSTAGGGGFAVADALRDIIFQLLLPFAAGQLIRPWVAGVMDRHKAWLGRYDQGVILLIVYSAFSISVTSGLWQDLPVSAVVLAILLCTFLLALVMGIASVASSRFGFSLEDEAAAVFCGSKKSLASGLPMAKVLFADHVLQPDSDYRRRNISQALSSAYRAR